MKIKKSLLSLSIFSGAALLTACGGDSDQTYSYKVEITNLTYAQPLSPAAIIVHKQDYKLFSEGQTASIELEQLAESGNAENLISRAQQEDSVFHQGLTNGLIQPGDTYEYNFSLNYEVSDQAITIATMLVNTNDGFTGINAETIIRLRVNQTQEFYGPVWDSGTEGNSETAATIPGPAGGGEGFNSSRDDLNKIIFHSGVVSQGDGLAGSALTEQHRFNQPASSIRITRTR